MRRRRLHQLRLYQASLYTALDPHALASDGDVRQPINLGGLEQGTFRAPPMPEHEAKKMKSPYAPYQGRCSPVAPETQTAKKNSPPSGATGVSRMRGISETEMNPTTPSPMAAVAGAPIAASEA